MGGRWFVVYSLEKSRDHSPSHSPESPLFSIKRQKSFFHDLFSRVTGGKGGYREKRGIKIRINGVTGDKGGYRELQGVTRGYLTIIPRARMGSESIAWAIDSEAMRVRGIIVLVKSK